MDLKQWCRNQAESAKKHKWIEGVKSGKDPGEKAVIEWVDKFAKDYRKEYKDCFDKVLAKVEKEVKNKLEDVKINEEQLHSITRIIIEQFTKEWIIEAAQDIKHIDEI